MAVTHLNALQVAGVPTMGMSGIPATIGNVWFVNSVNGAAGNSGAADNPFASITSAITASSAGDVIVLTEMHQETITTAGGVNCSVADVQIVGLGSGVSRPLFTFSTSTAATFLITANNVSVSNIRGLTTIDQIVSPFVVSGSHVRLELDWTDQDATHEALRAVLTTAAANDFYLTLLYHGYTAGTHGVNGVRIVGGRNPTINVNYYGICTTAVVEFVTTAVVDAQVTGQFYVSGTTNFSKNVVDTVGGSTWTVVGVDGAAGGTYINGGSGGAVGGFSAIQESAAPVKAAAVMVNGNTLWTVAGGPIEVMSILSICVTANDATASTLQYQATGTLGTTTGTISGATATLASATIGTNVAWQGTALATAPVINANGVNIVATNGGIVAPAGSIKIVVGVGSTTGTWQHYMRYKPLASGVTVS